jgi:hypothetical protein
MASSTIYHIAVLRYMISRISHPNRIVHEQQISMDMNMSIYMERHINDCFWMVKVRLQWNGGL